MTAETIQTDVDEASTTWEWRRVKVSRAPQATPQSRRRRGRWYHLGRKPRDTPTTLVLQWRGGAQSWWLVTARGSTGVFPGCAALEDIMHQVLNER